MNGADVMTQDVIVESPSTSVDDAAHHRVGGISGLPVVNERGVIIGIITEGDLVEVREGDETPDGDILGLDDEEDPYPTMRGSAAKRHRVLAGEVRVLD